MRLNSHLTTSLKSPLKEPFEQIKTNYTSLCSHDQTQINNSTSVVMMIVVLQDVHVFFSLRVYVLPFPFSFFAVQWHVVLSQPAFSPLLVSPLPIRCLFLKQLLRPKLWRILHSMFLAQANNQSGPQPELDINFPVI